MSLSSLNKVQAIDAIKELMKSKGSKITKNDILDVIKRVSIIDETVEKAIKNGKKPLTLLFAGSFNPGNLGTHSYGNVHIGELSSALYRNNKDAYRVITRTEVPGVLRSKELKQAVERAIQHEDNLMGDDLTKAIHDFINKGPDSLWGNRSAAFAAETVGDVSLIAGETLDDVTILYHAEIPALLKSNTYKGSINGITKNQLNSFLSTFDGQGFTESELYNLLGSSVANKAQVDMKNMTVVYGKNKKIISVGFEPIELTKITEEITDIKKDNQLFFKVNIFFSEKSL